MGWSFHDLFKAARSILVYAQSIFFSRCETEPYKRTVSTAARKKFLFLVFSFELITIAAVES